MTQSLALNQVSNLFKDLNNKIEVIKIDNEATNKSEDIKNEYEKFPSKDHQKHLSYREKTGKPFIMRGTTRTIIQVITSDLSDEINFKVTSSPISRRSRSCNNYSFDRLNSQLKMNQNSIDEKNDDYSRNTSLLSDTTVENKNSTAENNVTNYDDDDVLDNKAINQNNFKTIIDEESKIMEIRNNVIKNKNIPRINETEKSIKKTQNPRKPTEINLKETIRAPVQTGSLRSKIDLTNSKNSNRLSIHKCNKCIDSCSDFANPSVDDSGYKRCPCLMGNRFYYKELRQPFTESEILNNSIHEYDLWNDNYDLIFSQKYYSFFPFKNYKIALKNNKQHLKKRNTKASQLINNEILNIETYLKENNFKISKRKPWNSSF